MALRLRLRLRLRVRCDFVSVAIPISCSTVQCCFFCFGLEDVYNPHSRNSEGKKRKGKRREDARWIKERKDGAPGKSGNKLCRAKVIQEEEVRRDDVVIWAR